MYPPRSARTWAIIFILALASLAVVLAGGAVTGAHASNVVTSTLNTIYLPLILNNFTPPTLLPNGDFESGRTGWTEFSLKGLILIFESADLPVPPHGGNWAAWLGGADDEINYIEQQVTVPVGMPYLAYWHWIASIDACGFDFGDVLIDGALVDVYDLCSAEDTGGWVKYVVDLNAYKGQTVMLQIRVETDSSLNSNLFVDDVAFQSTSTALQGLDGGELDIDASIIKPAELELEGSRGLQEAERVFPPPAER